MKKQHTPTLMIQIIAYNKEARYMLRCRRVPGSNPYVSMKTRTWKTRKPDEKTLELARIQPKRT